MAQLPTGRSRGVLVACDASFEYTTSFDPVLGAFNRTGRSSSVVEGWGTGASVTGGLNSISADGRDFDFGLNAGIGLGGTEIVETGGSVHLEPGEGSFPQITSVGGSAVGTAAYTATEYENLGAPYERTGDIDRTLDASVTIGWATVGGPPGAHTILASGSVTLTGSYSDTLTGPFGVAYDHTITLEAQGSSGASGSIDVAADGISYGQGVSATAGGASLGGTVVVPSLTPDGIIDLAHLLLHVASAVVRGEPDFATSVAIGCRHYDGAPFSGVELEYRTASVIDGDTADAGGAAALRYPNTSGLSGWVSYTLADGDTSPGPQATAAGDNGEHLSVYLGRVKIVEGWADGYGDYLYSLGGNSACGLYTLPPFSAADLLIDPAHVFRHFADVTGWVVFGSGASLALSGGFWTFTTGDSPGDASSPTPFLPFAYRYLTLKVRADTPGAIVTLRLRWYLLTSGGTDYFAGADYQYQIEAADTWEEKRIDLCFPTSMYDQVYASGSLPQRYPVHPIQVQKGYEANPAHAFGLALHLATPGVVYQVEELRGFHDDTGDRTPIALHAPLQADVPGFGEIVGAKLNAYEPGFPAPSGLDNQRGGSLWGRLVPNGALGMDFLDTTLAGTVESAWGQFADKYDDAANDTGIHITPSGAVAASRNAHATSYLAAGTEIGYGYGYGYGGGDVPGIPCVRRIPALYGYYGMGTSYGNGPYGTVLEFSGDLLFDGYLQGLTWSGATAKTGVSVAILDNDTETVLQSLTSDDDGWFGTEEKYGVRKPFSNLPTDSTDPADHQQYALTGATEYDPLSYTVAGLLLNSYWALSDRFQNRDGSDIARYDPGVLDQRLYGTDRLDLVVLDRYVSHYDLRTRLKVGQPDNFTDALGRFHRVSVDDDGQVLYHRSDVNTPEGGWAVETNLGTGSEPALTWNDHDLRLRVGVVYQRQRAGGSDYDVFIRQSDSDGEDWELEALLIPGGTHPRAHTVRVTQERVIAAYVSGGIQGVYRRPGDLVNLGPFTFADETDTPLSVEDDSFGLTDGIEPGTGLLRWVLSIVILGETEVSEWTSDYEPDSGDTYWNWELVI